MYFATISIQDELGNGIGVGEDDQEMEHYKDNTCIATRFNCIQPIAAVTYNLTEPYTQAHIELVADPLYEYSSCGIHDPMTG